MKPIEHINYATAVREKILLVKLPARNALMDPCQIYSPFKPKRVLIFNFIDLHEIQIKYPVYSPLIVFCVVKTKLCDCRACGLYDKLSASRIIKSQIEDKIHVVDSLTVIKAYERNIIHLGKV